VKTFKTVMVRKLPNPTDKHVGSRVRIRRMTLGKSQSWLGNAVGLTFQQIQKYEKGTNRIGSSRLQQFANLLDVPVSFFFEGAPGASSRGKANAAGLSPAYVSKFISSSDGLTLIKAFMQIKDVKLRRGIAKLVEQIADRHED
jgi:transcriptional regulator with XRE-family HTH domain